MPNQWEERFRKFVKLLASALPIIGLTGMGGIVAAWTTLAIKATSLNEREEKPIFVDDLISTEDIESSVRLPQGKGSPLPLYEIAAKRLHERVRPFDSQRDEARTLQPGNSIVQVFTLQTTRAILFSPTSYNLHIQSEYRMDRAVNQDSVDYQLNVRAPLRALILGSVVGSLCRNVRKMDCAENALLSAEPRIR
jgi:hypothetical protein